MKSLTWSGGALVLVLGLAALSVFSGEHAAETTPDQAEELPEGVSDMTKAWQASFGLDGKLKIVKGRMDTRGAAADGPECMSFEAQAEELGWYGFTFVHVDEVGRAYEAVLVSVNVREDAKNSKRMIVSPNCKSVGKMLSVAPRELFIVGWDYNPGGEGVPDGWELAKTAYGSRPQALAGSEREHKE